MVGEFPGLATLDDGDNLRATADFRGALLLAAGAVARRRRRRRSSRARRRSRGRRWWAEHALQVSGGVEETRLLPPRREQLQADRQAVTAEAGGHRDAGDAREVGERSPAGCWAVSGSEEAGRELEVAAPRSGAAGAALVGQASRSAMSRRLSGDRSAGSEPGRGRRGPAARPASAARTGSARGSTGRVRAARRGRAPRAAPGASCDAAAAPHSSTRSSSSSTPSQPAASRASLQRVWTSGSRSSQNGARTMPQRRRAPSRSGNSRAVKHLGQASRVAGVTSERAGGGEGRRRRRCSRRAAPSALDVWRPTTPQ